MTSIDISFLFHKIICKALGKLGGGCNDWFWSCNFKANSFVCIIHNRHETERPMSKPGNIKDHVTKNVQHTGYPP
ncbi:hypothetical protein V1478_007095 [Vespula squamosa]|uniref:Uncharacterized protein n=1 Tax=Vespula squamosa TaxID=30214 RepID=A0ABD2B265_VESSQ